MDSSPGPNPSDSSPAGESKAQREARLRRERRNAKIQAGGSERLNKITSLSGRPAAAEAELSRTPSPRSAQRSTPRAARADDDPDEVDISTMFQRPPAEAVPSIAEQQALLRQMMRGGDPGLGDQAGPGAGGPVDPSADDPMMRMMQQMLGGMGGDGQGPPGGAKLPPGLENLLSGMNEPEQPANSADYLWRIVHAVSSLLIAVYAVSTSDFTGSRFEREIGAVGGARLFYLFATAELVLQSGRYFLDRGRLPSSSIMGKIAAFLPEPYGGYLRVFNRYSIIFTTIQADALVVLFVLGATAWWKGSVER